jgi:VanZ family protein
LVWALFLAGWTSALLTPEPVEIADAVLPPETVFSASKLLHVAAYAVLAVLTGWLPVSARVRWLLLLVLSAHTLATEYLQGFVPTRTASWLDVGIDHVGIGIGIGITWKWWAGAKRQAGSD